MNNFNFIILEEHEYTPQDVWHEYYFYGTDPIYPGNKGHLIGRLFVNPRSKSSMAKAQRWRGRLLILEVNFIQSTWVVNQKELTRRTNEQKFRSKHTKTMNAYKLEKQKILNGGFLFFGNMLAELDKQLEEVLKTLECRYETSREVINKKESSNPLTCKCGRSHPMVLEFGKCDQCLERAKKLKQ